MAQINLFVDESMAKKLNDKSRELGYSVSKYILMVVAEELEKGDSEETRKKRILLELRGAVNDNTFSIHHDI